MGLDMYLEAGYPQLRPESEEELEWREVIYWRKANWIHGWFVRFIEGDEDESTKYYAVTREELARLAEACTLVIEFAEAGKWSDAQRLLPPHGGFFFGKYDQELPDWDPESQQDYLEETRRTAEELRRVLRGAETEHFRYMAWW